MATSEENPTFETPTGRRPRLLEGRPLAAMVVVLLITGGHTMNLRELGVSQGWVPAELYSIQSSYLVSLALMMLACPSLTQRFSCRGLAQCGMMMAVAGAVLNGLEVWLSLPAFIAGRAVAGAGAGMVIYCAPRLLDPRWRVAAAWAVILCPVAGPGVVSLATMFYEVSSWQFGFLFEAAAAATALVVLLSMPATPESRPWPPKGSLAYLPGLVIASVSLLYVLHWGQLQGWEEAPDIITAAAVGVAALIVTLYLAHAQIDWPALAENWPRLALFFFGGLCQFFYGYIMNVYGGMIANLSSWQRVWLIWPLPIGMAASLTLSQVRWRHGRIVLGLPGAVVGLAVLSTGLYLCFQHMMEWPYWDIRNTIDLNWFPAPGHWELAPGRFLMGLGIGLFMVAMDAKFSTDPEREEKVRPFLSVVQFYGGGLAAAIMINFLIIGHKVHYSYSADRDVIQADELMQRQILVRHELHEAGQPAPDRSAEVLLFRFVNYEADNLVFATMYAIFFLTALSLSGFFLGLWIWMRLRASTGLPAP